MTSRVWVWLSFRDKGGSELAAPMAEADADEDVEIPPGAHHVRTGIAGTYEPDGTEDRT